MPELFSRLSGRTEVYLAAVIVVLCAGLGLASKDFLTLANAVDLIESYSVTAVMAMGLFVVLVAGGIDISFAATASVAQYAAATAATTYGFPAPAAIATGLGVGLLLGLINAALIHGLRAASIIVTIATMSVYFALLMHFTGGKSIYLLPDWWVEKVWLFSTDDVRIGLPIAMMAGVVLLTWIMMTQTAAGRQLTAMGGNPEAARRIGINIGAMHALAYGYLGVTAALAGLLQGHRVEEAVPNAMVGQELNVLAAAVLGGASLNGGLGTVSGVLLGILLLAILQNGLNLLGVSSYFFQIVIGLAILVSTSVTGLSARRGRRVRGVGAVHG